MGDDAQLVFSGEEHFKSQPQQVFALLTDLDSMQQVIPDMVVAERVDEKTLRCVVRPGFSFLRGTLKLNITLVDLTADEQATMHVVAQGIGVSMRLRSTLHVTSEEEGSKLKWEAIIDERKGLVAALSTALVKAAADQVIRHAWTQVRKQLGE